MAQVGSLEKLYQTYKDRADFLLVYIKEAHPGSIIEVPAANGSTELQVVGRTSGSDERLANLRKVMKLGGLTMPAVIDDDEGSVQRAYTAWPDRLYVVGVDGKIGYKGGPGPSGFRVPELEAWLKANVK
jgi:hypothetical protein